MDITGRLRIEWPPTSPDRAGIPVWPTRLFDADTEADIGKHTIRFTVDAIAGDLVHADLTMLVDENETPTDRPVVGEEGVARTGVFRYVVAEMRIQP